MSKCLFVTIGMVLFPINKFISSTSSEISHLTDVNIIRNSHQEKNLEEIPKLKPKIIEPFSEKLLIKYLIDLNVKFPHIVLAQAKLESGHFKSKIFMENNNLFGMREAKVRPHTALGTRFNHAYYADWKQSVIDYALYQSSYLKDFKTEKEYLEYIDERYAESGNYAGTLINLIERDSLRNHF